MPRTMEGFIRRKLSNKWTSQETDRLRLIVLEIRPKNIEGWKQVCLKMHQFGSRRLLREYKNRGTHFLYFRQGQQIKFIGEYMEEICNSFETGLSIPQLVNKYGQLFQNRQIVRGRLNQAFASINRSIRRIVTSKQARVITKSDYKVFSFIRQKKQPLLSLHKVLYLSRRYGAIRKHTTEEELKEIKSIQEELQCFNYSLRRYSEQFDEVNKKTKAQIIKEPLTSDSQHKQIKIQQWRIKSPAVQVRHLSEYAQNISRKMLASKTKIKGNGQLGNKCEVRFGNLNTSCDLNAVCKQWISNQFDYQLRDIEFSQQNIFEEEESHRSDSIFSQ